MMINYFTSAANAGISDKCANVLHVLNCHRTGVVCVRHEFCFMHGSGLYRESDCGNILVDGSFLHGR